MMGKYYLIFYVALMLINDFNCNLMVSAGIINSTVKDTGNKTNNGNSQTGKQTTTTSLLSAVPDGVEADPSVSDGQLTSDTNQKTTRQIFSGSKEEPPAEDDRFSDGRDPGPSAREDASGGRKQSNTQQQFDAFPDGFTQGPKPFQFQDNDAPRDPQNAGFTDFPSEDKFPSLSSSLGGLPPLSQSPRPPPSGSPTTRVTNTNLPTDDSPSLKQEDPQQQQPQHDFPSAVQDDGFDPQFQSRPRFTPTNNRPSFPSGRPPLDDPRGGGGRGFDDGFQDTGRGVRPGSFQEDFQPPQDDSRFQQRRPTSFQSHPTDNFQSSPGGQFEDSPTQIRPQPSQRKPIADDQTSNFDFQGPDSQFGHFNEGPSQSGRGRGSGRPLPPLEPFDSGFNLPPSNDESRPTVQQERRRPPNSPSAASRVPIDDNRQFQDFDNSNDGQSFTSRRPSSTSSSPTSNTKFRDSDQFDFSQQQRFVPITQFNDGPFPEFGGFRPLTSNNDGQQGFRSNSNRHHQPPQQSFAGQFDNSEFSDTDPTIFNQRGPSADEGNSNFGGSRPQNFHQQDEPEFNRPPQDFDDQPRSQQSTENERHREDHQPRVQRLHNDDTTNHHSSATTNLLGSGNFGVLRGGIFPDNEGISRPTQFQPIGRNSPFHGGGNDEDFFSGFRDFQPFGGNLHNALSSQSQKVHNQPLRTVKGPLESAPHINNDQSSDDFSSQHNKTTSTTSRG